MPIPVRPNTDQILATLSLLEDHVRGARGACSAFVRFANLPDEPKIVAPSAAESLSMANGQSIPISQANSSQREQQIAQVNQAIGQHLGQIFGLSNHLHELVSETKDEPNNGVVD